MKIVKPKFEELQAESPLALGELCTRVCYKSEDHIKEGSAKKLLTGIASAGHTAMLEHVPVYFKVTPNDDNDVSKALGNVLDSPYTKIELYLTAFYVSTNLRVIFENHKKFFDEFMSHDGKPFSMTDEGATIDNCKFSDYPDEFVRRITIKFTTDRIGSQSFCRHRVFSFAQESTRYVNYLREKFGSELSIIDPCWLREEDRAEFEADMAEIEKYYFKWINKGYKAEEARAFLPFDVKTEIIMTGFPDAWQHFFDLRNDSHAHPQAQELAKPLQEYFKEKNYI